MLGENERGSRTGSGALQCLPHNELLAQRRAIERALRQGSETRDLELFYQPQMDLLTGNIVGMEALLRWRCDEHAVAVPAQLIAIAQRCGLMVPLGRWVLRQASRQAQAWQQAGFPSMRIGVNVTAAELCAAGFASEVRSILFESGLAPHLLELELAESFLEQDPRANATVLGELKQLGVQLALTIRSRYSSLQELQRRHVDTVKIDRSLVQQLGTTQAEAGAVCAMIRKGKALRMQIVADGVERRAQLEFLQQHGCPYGQGFYFGRPACAEELTQTLMRARRRRTLQVMSTTSSFVSQWFRRQAGRSTFARAHTSVRGKCVR